MKIYDNILNAITEALRDMEKHPDDSVQDVWNKALESWQTGLHMDHHYNVDLATFIELRASSTRRRPRSPSVICGTWISQGITS